jgi:hypothetical protein
VRLIRNAAHIVEENPGLTSVEYVELANRELALRRMPAKASRDLPFARASAPRCRSHRDGCGREVGPIVTNEPAADQNPFAAFDAHLIGVDPDFRIHVSDRLLDLHDGPFLELGLKGIAGTLIEMPRRAEDRPDRDRLALRFELFKSLHNGVDKS